MPSIRFVYCAVPTVARRHAEASTDSSGIGMNKLTRDDLWSLEDYADARSDFRRKVLEHKRDRKVALGRHVTLLFEDRMTIQYQIQEMLRVERIFERAGIEEELAAYNPLIPDGTNLKATMFIEYDNVVERQGALQRLRGIEDQVCLNVGEVRVAAVADEDLERGNEDKTAAVHFLRFELSEQSRAQVRGGVPIRFSVEHPAYCEAVEPKPAVQRALAADFG